ncbi:flagellar filament capping protein FliD [Paenibacillus roseipurpureus]|uniref:Flagellar hook-associated protein 2 n=1 Tax=Paenibacillus roseopurpureus TaxID=2918901 RepID=A0AA96LRQ6_9BACL|nr:flagellar filament capping protein FliD [Paenibacillus sp. MBLB1832]WNR44698.1 flagellar filament capping protein FliD [Paenibacillus sp. MBLB1832]
MVTRLNGFSGSGIDIDDTVSKLMKAARMPQNKLKQNKQTLEWQRDDYRAMNSKIMEFRNIAFNMKLQSAYQTKKSSSSDDSIVSATSSSNAAEGIYTLKVNKLASGAKVTSDVLALATSNSSTLEDLGLSSSSTLTVGGQKGTITLNVEKADTIASLVSRINSKTSVTGVGVNYDSTMKRLFFVSSGTGQSAEVNLQMESSNGTTNLLKDVLGISSAAISGTTGQTYKGTNTFSAGTTTIVDSTITSAQTLRVSAGGKTVDVTVSSSSAIGNVIDAINSSDVGKLGISAYITSDNKLAFFAPGGEAITLSDQTADGTDITTNFALSAPTSTSYSQLGVKGTQADVEFNGVSAKYDSNTFSINGMTFTAKKEQAPTDSAVSITTTRDVDGVYNSIKTLVDKYNELITTVNTKVSEKKYKDFSPLTDEQREGMKDDQIKAWEEKAKSGLLRNDDLLSSGLTNFRTSFSAIVTGLPTGDYKTLSEIGISTSLIAGNSISGSYSENGKIYINDAKLKAAIAENPDEVMALFITNDGDKDSDAGDGLATKLYDKATRLISNLTKKAGATSSVDSNYLIGKSINSINTNIDKLTAKLDALETRYYNQFTAMEKYITQMQAQSAQLSQQMGG